MGAEAFFHKRLQHLSGILLKSEKKIRREKYCARQYDRGEQGHDRYE